MKRILVIATLFMLVAWIPEGREIRFDDDCVQRTAVNFTRILIDDFGSEKVAEWITNKRIIRILSTTDSIGRVVKLKSWESNIDDFEKGILPIIEKRLLADSQLSWPVCIHDEAFTEKQRLRIVSEEHWDIVYLIFSARSVNSFAQCTDVNELIALLNTIKNHPEKRFIGYKSDLCGRMICKELSIVLPDSVSKHCYKSEGRVCITCDGIFHGDNFEIKSTTLCNLWDDSLFVGDTPSKELMDFFKAYVQKNIEFENYHNPSINYDSIVSLDLRIDIESQIQ